MDRHYTRLSSVARDRPPLPSSLDTYRYGSIPRLDFSIRESLKLRVIDR